jgi:hypothetical protein
MDLCTCMIQNIVELKTIFAVSLLLRTISYVFKSKKVNITPVNSILDFMRLDLGLSLKLHN